jgi:hypothetical protein
MNVLKPSFDVAIATKMKVIKVRKKVRQYTFETNCARSGFPAIPGHIIKHLSMGPKSLPSFYCAALTLYMTSNGT